MKYACPLCGQPVSSAQYRKITGIWEERRRLLAKVREERTKLAKRIVREKERLRKAAVEFGKRKEPGSPPRLTGWCILIRELDRSRDLAYGCEVILAQKGELHVSADSFCLLDMRQVKRPDWMLLIDWESCKLDDAIEILRKEFAERLPLEAIGALFG